MSTEAVPSPFRGPRARFWDSLGIQSVRARAKPTGPTFLSSSLKPWGAPFTTFKALKDPGDERSAPTPFPNKNHPSRVDLFFKFLF